MVNKETVVGELIRIVGEVHGDEDLVVRGRIAGTIQLGQTLTVDGAGIVEADVDVHTLVVAGVLVGAIRASHAVRFTSTARVVGDIITPRFIMEAGAAFRGRVEIGSEEGDHDDDRDDDRSGRKPTNALGRVPARPAGRLPAALSGALEQVGISSLLTLMELERRTGVLELRSRRAGGQLVLREGFVVSATVDGQVVPGCDAVTEYLGWPGGRFVFRVGEVGVADEVIVPTTLLLLEAARRTDETPARERPITTEVPVIGERPVLSGALEHVGVTSVLTLLEMERRLGVLEVRSRRQVSELTVRDGCVIAATIDGEPMPVCDAVCELVTWDRGRFAFRMAEVSGEDGEAVPTTLLLLEAGRRADANAAA